MQKKQITFTREFKMEAIKLAESGKKPITQIARDLGISDSAIHNWRKLYGVHGEQTFPGSGHQTPQEEEIRQLKRENELLRQERDILKKLSASSHDDRTEIPMYCRLPARISYPGDVSSVRCL